MSCFCMGSKAIKEAPPQPYVVLPVGDTTTTPNAPTEQTTTSTMTTPVGVSAEFLQRFVQDLRSELQGKRNVDDMSTTDVCVEFVMPATKERQLAYIDLLDHTQVGKATVFVSHAWKYKFIQVVEVMLRFHEENKQNEQQFFWFDLFVNNQHLAPSLPPDWWKTTFRQSVGKIGHTLLVMSPWDNPLPLTRAWCLWEILCTIQEQAKLDIAMQSTQLGEFSKAVLHDLDVVMHVFADVRAEKAEATVDSDRKMIFEAITTTVGFQCVNEVVKDEMRKWIVGAAQQIAASMGAVSEQPILTRFYVGVLMSRLAHVMLSLGRNDDAKAKFESALRLWDSVFAGLDNNEPFPSDDAEMTSSDKLRLKCKTSQMGAIAGLGDVEHHNGQYSAADEHYQRALDICVQIDGPTSSSAATLQSHIAGLLYQTGKIEQAAAHYNRALTLYTRLGETDTVAYATAIEGMGLVLKAAGEWKDSVVCLTKALEIKKAKLGRENESTGRTYLNIANLFLAIGHTQMAEQYLHTALEICRQTLGEDHMVVADIYNNLGSMYRDSNRFEESVKNLKLSINIKRKLLGTHHERLAVSYGGLGAAFFAKGELDTAILWLQQSLEVYLATVGPNHIGTAQAHGVLGDVLAQQGDVVQALAHLEKSMVTLEQLVGKAHPHYVAFAAKYQALQAKKSSS